jgi:hypothetical protein
VIDGDSVEFAPCVKLLLMDPVVLCAGEHPPGAAPIVGSVGNAPIPQNADVMIYGVGGSSKTTLSYDLAVHLAAGDDWLGIPIPAPVRVLIVENEGPRPLARKKLEAKLAGWNGSPLEGRLVVLEEPWGRVNLADESHRAILADRISDGGIDVVFAGPLTRIGMEEAGTLQDVRDFGRLLNDVRDRAGRLVTFVLIHHESKSGQVSGAWEGATDTLLHLQALGHGKTRVFWAKARWASELHGTTMHLAWAEGESFTIEQREEVTEATMADQMLAAALELPGGSWSKIRDRVTGNGSEAATVRDRLLSEGLLVNTAARHGYFNLWHHDDPAATRSEPGTALERLTYPSTEADAEPTRSTVPPLGRNGGGNGTARSVDDPSSDRPLPGGDGYLKHVWPAFENGHLTAAEWTQLEHAHQLLTTREAGA